MNQTNKGRESALSTLGIRGGTTQYAGGVQMGIMGEELNQANDRIGELVRQEQEAIASARNAYQTGKFSQFAAKMAVIEKTRDEKSKAYEDYNKKLTDMNDKLAETEIQTKIDTNVGDFLDKGITSSSEISKELAKLGIKATSKQIKDSVSNLTNDDLVKSNVKSVSDWADTAFKGGETEIASKIQALNPMSNTFSQELSKLQSQMKNPIAKLDIQLKQLDLANKQSDLAKKQGESGGTKSADLPLIEARATDKILKLDGLLANNIGLGASAGFKNISINPLNFNKVNDWRADMINTLSKLTVDELGRVKADGVTFGALSDPERKAVGDAASAINAAAIMEKGEPTGRYKMSEEKLRKEIGTIKDLALIDYKKRTGQDYVEPTKRVDDYANTAINAINSSATLPSDDQLNKAGYKL
jgi:hypothetical protein